MTDNKISEIERELWEKLFLTSQSIKCCIERYQILKEECEKELDLTGSPSREQINEMNEIGKFLNISISVISVSSSLLIDLNPNFRWN